MNLDKKEWLKGHGRIQLEGEMRGGSQDSVKEGFGQFLWWSRKKSDLEDLGCIKIIHLQSKRQKAPAYLGEGIGEKSGK